jgi:hypothetical protein
VERPVLGGREAPYAPLMKRGQHEVHAHVEARVLGMRLLSLTARVLTGEPASPFGDVLAAPSGDVVMGRPDRARVQAPPPRRQRRRADVGELDRAISLLEESSMELRQLTAQSPGRTRQNGWSSGSR